MKKLLLCTLTSVLAIGFSFAQVGIKVEPIKKTYVCGEPLTMNVTIINNTGAPLDLKSKGFESWLDIHIERAEGQMQMPQSRFSVFPALSVPTGKQVSKKIDLRHFYDLPVEGMYRAQAIAKLPNGTAVGTPKQTFFITPGTVIWKNTVLIPGSSKKCRFVVLGQTDHKGIQKIYMQVRDGDTDIPYNATCVGNWLRLEQPKYLVDSKCNLHLLFLTTPQLCCYARMDFRGKVTRLAYFKRTVARPNLTFLPDGSVQVVGGVLFDPHKPVQKVPDATTIPSL